MNELDDLTAEERQWAERVGKALRASELTLDAVAVARLRAARARALSPPPPARGAWLLAAPAALTAAVLAWTLVPRATLQPEPAVVNLAGADALDVLTDERGPEFYENLDLYLWLEEPGEVGPSGA